MLNIDMTNDNADELRGVVNSLISGMLPHKNYKAECFTGILSNTVSYIHLEEFNMEYYVLLKALDGLNRIKMDTLNYSPLLTRDIFSDIVEASAEDLVTNPSIKIKQFLDREGMNSNLDIPASKEAALQKLYTRSMELYDNCFALEQDSSTAVNFVPAYEGAFVTYIGIQSIMAQNTIITGSLQVGKRVYSGFSDWREYNTYLMTELNTRLDDVASGNDITVIDSLTKVSEMYKALRQTFIPICNWGIPELDGDGVTSGTPILRHRLDVIVGSVNVGKSMFCKDAAVNVAIAHGKVLYMYGESSKEIIWADLLVNYIFKTFGLFVTQQQLAYRDELPDEIKRVISVAETKLYEEGSISLRAAYEYDNLKEQLENDYKKYNFDMLVIDHSLALISSGKSNSENVHNLAIACRDFKREYPVHICVASHPSSAAKPYLANNKRVPSDIDVTKESSTLTAEADDIYILRSNDVLKKQNIIALENHKRRNAPVLDDYVILDKAFDVCHFEYDPNKQNSATRDNVSAEEALQDLEDLYEDDVNDSNYL